MHDTYTHTEACTQTFKDHLRTHIGTRKQSLTNTAAAAAAPAPTPGVSSFSAETLVNAAPDCTCGLPSREVKDERLWMGGGGGGEKKKCEDGPFCDCKQRVTVIGEGEEDEEEGQAPVVGKEKEKEKKGFGSKALNLFCTVCTGYVAKPKAGGFYPMEQ